MKAMIFYCAAKALKSPKANNLPTSQDAIKPIQMPENNGEEQSAILPKIEQALRARRRLGETGFIWFLRLLSFFCMGMGIYWSIRIVGIFEGDLWRFDLMPTPWKLITLVMSLLYLFASVGLWLLAPWGAVVWFVAAIIEVTIYVPLGNMFGYSPMNIITNVLIALLFGAFRIWQEVQQRAERDVAKR